jgi:hypothetical protein
MALQPQAQLEVTQVAMAALQVSVQPALALKPPQAQGPEAQERLQAERALAAPQPLEEMKRQEQEQ